MTINERKELIEVLALNYVRAKKQDAVYQRENSSSYYVNCGMLRGACMALGLYFKDTDNGVIVFTNKKNKIVAKIELN